MDRWQLVGILGLIAVAACWALAVVLYRVGTTGSVARKLSLLLVVEGVVLATAFFPVMALGLPLSFYDLHPLYDRISFFIHTVAECAMFALYPPFLAAALQTKLTRPFARKRMRIGLAVVSVVVVFAVQLSPLEIGASLLYVMLSLLFGFALVASLNAWYVATDTNRARARAFAIAFGIRDVFWGIVYLETVWMVWLGNYLSRDLQVYNYWIDLIYALGTLLAVPLIAYGILRAHLFDIDLRIRWTIKQSTLATIVVTLIFLFSEGADRFLSAELGNFAGLLAAGVVVFFLAPLQRLAERVATVAMPNTQDTPEYATFRKMQVYEEAVAEAQFEGGISQKERALLSRLRDSLGISASDADTIEGELQMHGATVG